MKSLVLPVLVGALSINFLTYKPNPNNTDVAQLEQSMRAAKTLVKIDTQRQRAYEKVDRIIERFNPAMPVDQRRALAYEIYAAAVRYPNLDVDLICATITHESARSWQPDIMSKAGAMGLMQIMPRTGVWLARYENISFTSPEQLLFNPVYNIRLGTRYLSALIEAYDLEGGLAAYNGGATRVKLWLARNKASDVLWSETRDYVPYVLKLYNEFKAQTL